MEDFSTWASPKVTRPLEGEFCGSSLKKLSKRNRLSRDSSVGCQNITAKKPESTRRTIFNRDSTLQLIVQISSGNVNSSVRARTKTHGRTPVSIELPRGRHLGSDACIS